MDKPIALVLSIVLAVLGMIAVGVIMWGQISAAQEDIEDVNPYAGITNTAVCAAAGGTWTAANAAGKQCHK